MIEAYSHVPWHVPSSPHIRLLNLTTHRSFGTIFANDIFSSRFIYPSTFLSFSFTS
jgi:hypothetical protein